MFSSLLGATLFSLALGATASSHGPVHHRRHEEIAAQVNNVTETHLHRRGQTYTGARLTYYDVGLWVATFCQTAEVTLNGSLQGCLWRV